MPTVASAAASSAAAVSGAPGHRFAVDDADEVPLALLGQPHVEPAHAVEHRVDQSGEDQPVQPDAEDRDVVEVGKERQQQRDRATAQTTTAASRSASPSWARTRPRTSASPTCGLLLHLHPRADDPGARAGWPGRRVRAAA